MHFSSTVKAVNSVDFYHLQHTPIGACYEAEMIAMCIISFIESMDSEGCAAICILWIYIFTYLLSSLKLINAINCTAESVPTDLIGAHCFYLFKAKLIVKDETTSIFVPNMTTDVSNRQ